MEAAEGGAILSASIRCMVDNAAALSGNLEPYYDTGLLEQSVRPASKTDVMAYGVKANRHVLETRERTLGRENPDTLTSVNNLAFLLEARGNYADAGTIRVRTSGHRRRGDRPPDPARP